MYIIQQLNSDKINYNNHISIFAYFVKILLLVYYLLIIITFVKQLNSIKMFDAL